VVRDWLRLASDRDGGRRRRERVEQNRPANLVEANPMEYMDDGALEETADV